MESIDEELLEADKTRHLARRLKAVITLRIAEKQTLAALEVIVAARREALSEHKETKRKITRKKRR